MRRLRLLLILPLLPLAAVGYLFAAGEPLRGDVDRDGSITSVDALAILSYVVGKPLPEGQAVMPNGDNNDDGQVTAIDALIALSYTVGKDVTQFPIGKPIELVHTIDVDPPTAFVLVGQTAQLTATVKDSAGTVMAGKTVTWTSSDSSVVSVSAAGVVTAKALGLARITASVASKKGTAQVEGDSLVPATISAGGAHTCALTTAGAAFCWGSNASGQLGDGSTADRSTPTAVSGNRTYKTISAGGNHTVALATNGAAFAWGAGWVLGTGNGSGSAVPVSVAGGRTYTAVSAGRRHTVALTATGAAYAWGIASVGSLGDGGTDTDRTSPYPVTGGIAFAAVSAGLDYTVALDSAGNAYGWGLNDRGQLGTGNTSSRNAPTKVQGTQTFRAISAGTAHTVALSTTGEAFAWGDNYYMQLGDGTSTPRSAPVKVNGGLTFRTVSAGSNHTVALSSSGVGYAWGGNYPDGMLGTGLLSSESVGTPHRLAGSHAFRSVDAGSFHTVAVSHGGALYAWGSNAKGQVGDGTTSAQRTPVPVGGAMQGAGFGIAALPAVNLRQGNSGQIAVHLTRRGGFSGVVTFSLDGVPAGVTATFSPASLSGGATSTTLTLTAPASASASKATLVIRASAPGALDSEAQVRLTVYTDLLAVGALSAGATHTCGLTSKGQAWCWGSNGYGAIGLGVEPVNEATALYANPMPVAGAHAFQAISSGDRHTCALTEAGKAYCWGDNAEGQLGDGTKTTRYAPVAVATTQTFKAISAGGKHTVALTTAGAVYAWGNNDVGTFGDNTQTGSPTPKAVASGQTFVAIDAGNTHTLALDGTGRAWAWGWGRQAHTDLTKTYNLKPVALGMNVPDTGSWKGARDLRFVQVSAGATRNVGLTADGKAWEWGDETITDASATYGFTPVVVPAAAAFVAVSAGGGSILAIANDGTLYFWGGYAIDSGCTLDQVMQGTCREKTFSAATPRSFGEAVSISAGAQHAVAFGPNGLQYGWGNNSAGQLGDGTRTDRQSAVAQPVDYTVNLPPGVIIEIGKEVSVPITVTRSGGFSSTGVGFGGDVALTFNPTTGVTGTLSPSTITAAGSQSSILTVNATESAPTTGSLQVGSTSSGMAARSANMAMRTTLPMPTGTLNLDCGTSGAMPRLPGKYYCLEYEGARAPFTVANELHLPAGQWWVEHTFEVCVQWDATAAQARGRYKGGLTGQPSTTAWGDWGVIVKRDGTRDFSPQGRLIYTKMLDPQTRGLFFNETSKTFVNWNFVPGSCPW